jgi:hypothetical protein
MVAGATTTAADAPPWRHWPPTGGDFDELTAESALRPIDGHKPNSITIGGQNHPASPC